MLVHVAYARELTMNTKKDYIELSKKVPTWVSWTTVSWTIATTTVPWTIAVMWCGDRKSSD